MPKIHADYNDLWEAAYAALNEEQKIAVDTIEGPVMVIAGPGTGKTQLLAVRVGKILKQTDTQPHNILCLTFTEAGVNAMRKRLLTLIGPAAYHINISTFHSFCSRVIQENPDYFSGFRELDTLSDLEKVSVIRQMIDDLPLQHPLKRLQGDVYFDTYRFASLFDLMKQENWTEDTIINAFEEYKEYITNPATSPHTYTNNTVHGKKGEIKQNVVESELAKYGKSADAAKEFSTYNNAIKAIGRYDFYDMILFVIRAFQNHPNLLLDYQERYQYILVDEFQDSNGAQNNILYQLCSYWEVPNVFIVGDDDQSIYRFQGANMNSIKEFIQKFDPSIIVLKANYRSTQVILDASYKLIQNNVDRLEAMDPLINKRLIEKRKNPVLEPQKPKYFSYLNPTQQDVGILELIDELVLHGAKYEDIAILYRNHRIGANLIKYLLQNNIPINVNKRANILEEPTFLRLFKLLTYISDEFHRPFGNDFTLFEIMHFGFFNLPSLDIAKISMYCKPYKLQDGSYSEPLKMRTIIQDSESLILAEVKNPEPFIIFSKNIEHWIKDQTQETTIALIEKILTESGMLEEILQGPESTWAMQIVKTFLDWVKEETKKQRKLSLKDILERILVMEDANIEIAVNRFISYKNGINLMSVHGSKGLEFKHVIIMDLRQKYWDEKQGNRHNFSLPPTLSYMSKDGDRQDDRRLFYVATTRAKDTVYMTYPLMSETEKEQAPSSFLVEFKDIADPIEEPILSEDKVVGYTAAISKYNNTVPQLLDADLLNRKLENFRLSPTDLNKYLNCPLSLYYENIVGVPQAKSQKIAFGNVMHLTLEWYFRDIERSQPRSFGSFNTLLNLFKKSMEFYQYQFTDQEYLYMVELGKKRLDEYFTKQSASFLTPHKYLLEYQIYQTEHRGIPITGKMDRINFYQDHVSVTDYKTGKYNATKIRRPTDSNPLGGDYWRQIMFYKILIDSDKKHPWTLQYGEVDFILDENLKAPSKININSEDYQVVSDQIVEVYDKIMSHKFEQGCGEENCKWCNFVNFNNPLTVQSEDNHDD
ncbi:MAG: ATP-dependent DNA helicase [Saprospiraceae bacterium]